jgi:hypothetical protein
MQDTIHELEKDKANLKELLESTTQAAASAQRRAIQLEKDLADAGLEKSDGASPYFRTKSLSTFYWMLACSLLCAL